MISRGDDFQVWTGSFNLGIQTSVLILDRIHFDLAFWLQQLKCPFSWCEPSPLYRYMCPPASRCIRFGGISPRHLVLNFGITALRNSGSSASSRPRSTENFIDVLLVNHCTAFRTLRFGSEFTAKIVDIDFAIPELLHRLQTVPVVKVSKRCLDMG